MTSQLPALCRVPTVESTIDSLRAGHPVVLADQARSRGELVFPAESITTAQMAYLVRHTSGLVQVALPDQVCDELLLPQMLGAGRDGSQPCVAADASGVGTGISATDRALTARTLADPTSTPRSLVRPGHVIPVRVPEASGGRHRNDFAACALALMAMSNLRAAAVLATIVDSAAGIDLASGHELARFADDHYLELIDIADFDRRFLYWYPATGYQPTGDWTPDLQTNEENSSPTQAVDHAEQEPRPQRAKNC